MDIARFLVENGADINAVTGNQWTALYAASLQDHLDIVKLLIEHGADIATGRSALWAAIMKERPEVAAYLRSQGAKEIEGP